MPKVRIASVPGTGRVGVFWEVPDDPGGRTMLEPESVVFEAEDGTVTEHRLADMDLEEVPDETTLGLNRKLWAKNNGYPWGDLYLRPGGGATSIETRVEVRMPVYRPSPQLQRRRRAANRVATPAARQMVDAEEAVEREDFQAYLEARKRRGPG